MTANVRRMFASIAPSYDRANTVLSLGVHKRWRRNTVEFANAQTGERVVDCATGTGDLAREFASAVGPSGLVVGTDFCDDMLAAGLRKRVANSTRVDLQLADALALPYAHGSFDVASIAFGIRNVDDPIRCLREMARVARPRGRVVVLEFGQPKGALAAPYRFYSRHVIPRVGGLITGNREAYEYLPRTSAAFPSGGEFLDLMAKADVFRETAMRRLSNGIAYVYRGTVR